MDEAFIKRNVELTFEFDEYVAKYPKFLAKIPNRAYIVITIASDKEFNRNSVSMLTNIKRKKVIEAHKTAKRWNLRPLDLQTV